MPGIFDPAFEALPAEVPIFPLTGVLLLPRARLPLNIFEPRYLNMTTAAMAGDRLIGMVQPRGPNIGESPEVYRTGCAGRIVSFSETEDGRYLITLNGLIRFDISEELPLREGYRVATPDWAPYRDDLSEERDSGIDRERILKSLRDYFAVSKVEANWDAIEETPTDRLVNALAMMCPFQPSEKQALLEAPTLADRADVMTALLEMSTAAGDEPAPQHRN